MYLYMYVLYVSIYVCFICIYIYMYLKNTISFNCYLEILRVKLLNMCLMCINGQAEKIHKASKNLKL